MYLLRDRVQEEKQRSAHSTQMAFLTTDAVRLRDVESEKVNSSDRIRSSELTLEGLLRKPSGLLLTARQQMPLSIIETLNTWKKARENVL